MTEFLREHRGDVETPDDPRYLGFASIELDVPNSKVSVYWKRGEIVPIELLEKVAAFKGKGVSIDFVSSAFSAFELRSEMRTLVKQLKDSGLAWSKMGPSRGGSGLHVSLPTTGTLGRAAARTDGAELESLNRRLSTKAALPAGVSGRFVEVTTEEPPIPTSRHADSPPWWGGAEVLIGNAICSSGFALNNFWGEKTMLTAGHCAPLADGAGVTNGIGSVMGKTKHNGLANDNELDTVQISVSSNQAMIYDGFAPSEGWLSVNNYASDAYVGQWLCTSGAFSGPVCDIVIDSVELWIFTDVGLLDREASAFQLESTSAGGQGDSGGPVFSWRSGGKLFAEGTISALDPNALVPCTGATSVNGLARQCSSRIYFLPIIRALDYHAVWIQTR